MFLNPPICPDLLRSYIFCKLGGMSEYRHGSHTVFSIHLHIVWITKYRHKVLYKEVAERVRAIVREECRKSGVDILKGHVSSNHGHVRVSIPPQVTDQSSDPADEGEKLLSPAEGISPLTKAVLGAACMGAGVFLPQQWECDG